MVKAKALIEIECTCGQLILKSYSDGTTKLRSKITLFNGMGKSVAICRSCSREVVIPVKLNKGIGIPTRLYVIDK